MSLAWTNKTDDKDYILAEDVNALAAAIIENENNKVDKVSGKGLSDNNYTDEEKAKLTGIEPNANNFVLKVGDGLDIESDGSLYVLPATNDAIDGRTQTSAPIVPSTVNYAIKAALTDDNRISDMTNAEKENARGVIGASGENELKNLKSLSIPQGKAEGSSAKITDGLAGESPLKLNVYGNTDETSGVGDLNSASGKYEISVSATGKNLLRYPYANKNTTTNGITFKTQQDGTVLINGTASADAVFYIVYTNKPIILKKSKQYTLSGGKSYSQGIILCLQDTTFKQSTWGGTITAEYEKYYAFIKVNSGTTVTNLVLKPQLEEGTSATEYEKYISGGTLTAALDRQLNTGEYIDFIGKKLVGADGETDITVSGELEIPETEACYISAGTQMSPEKTEVGYFQDINKVIKEMKNSILSLGGNV